MRRSAANFPSTEYLCQFCTECDYTLGELFSSRNTQISIRNSKLLVLAYIDRAEAHKVPHNICTQPYR